MLVLTATASPTVIKKFKEVLQIDDNCTIVSVSPNRHNIFLENATRLADCYGEESFKLPHIRLHDFTNFTKKDTIWWTPHLDNLDTPHTPHIFLRETKNLGKNINKSDFKWVMAMTENVRDLYCVYDLWFLVNGTTIRFKTICGSSGIATHIRILSDFDWKKTLWSRIEKWPSLEVNSTSSA